jgi:hypothetical protein
MKKILQRYEELRKKQIPILRCGKTTVPATEEMPGFLQGAILLAKNIDMVKGAEQINTACGDLEKWIVNLEKTGTSRFNELTEWKKIFNLLNYNRPE